MSARVLHDKSQDYINHNPLYNPITKNCRSYVDAMLGHILSDPAYTFGGKYANSSSPVEQDSPDSSKKESILALIHQSEKDKNKFLLYS